MLTTSHPSDEGHRPRRLLRILTVSILTIPAALAFGGIAIAKGPQSATMTGPGIDQPIELMDNDSPQLISRLMEQTGIWYGTGDLPLPLVGSAGDLGPGYTLTWINSGPPSDSGEMRTIIQVIYLDAENGPVIHTPEGQKTLDGWGSDVTGWFVAPNGLRQTFEDLGVPLSTTASLDQPPPAENAVDASPAEVKSSESGVVDLAAESSSAKVHWVAVGLALAIALMWTVWRRRDPGHETEIALPSRLRADQDV